MNDEADALLHVEPDLADGRRVFRPGRCRFRRCSHQCYGCDQAGGRDETHRVKDVATSGSQVGDHECSDGGADDAHSEHDLLHQRVGRTQAMQGDGGADRNSLRRAEEAGDNADGGEDRVEVPDLMGHEEQEAKASADAVARDHGWFQGPAVDKNSGQNAEDRDGQHVGDLDAGDLLGGRVEVEGKDADHGEERKEVTEDRDDLRVPQAAQHRDAHHVAHRERRGKIRIDGWPGNRLGRGRVGGGCAHAR